MLWTRGDRHPANWGEPSKPARGQAVPVDDGGWSTDDAVASDLREVQFSPIPRPYYYDDQDRCIDVGNPPETTR